MPLLARVIPAGLFGESATQVPSHKLEPPVEVPRSSSTRTLPKRPPPIAIGPLPTFGQALGRGQVDHGKEKLITMLTVSLMSAVTLVWAYLVL